MNDIHIPDDLMAALSEDTKIADIFYRLPPSHKREYIKWVEDAKKTSTRVSRINRVVNMLRGKE